MRAIGKLPKGVLILEFIGMMLLAVALLSVSDSLSLLSHFLGRSADSDDFSRCFAHASRCGGGYSSGGKTSCPTADEPSTAIFTFRKRKR
ncbi:inner membrane protein [Escherichia coli]|nr:inner membrane protein [Escherichia coli]